MRLEKHPGIVQAIHVELIDGRLYVLTEWVSGPTGMGADLRCWIGSPALTPARASRMALRIAEGMLHATQKIPGLVHRDLKPANILVDQSGSPMVTDFGLAHAAEASAGTPAYMAPEQWRHEALGQPADIYSFGCVLFEMFTGQPVFAGDSIEAWRTFHIGVTPPRLRELRPGIPAEIESLVARCLSKDPGRRPSQWQEVWDELSASIEQDSGHVVASPLAVADPEPEELLAASSSMCNLGRFLEALELVDRALRVDAERPELWNNRGAALAGLNRAEEAFAAYNRAESIQPRMAAVWWNRCALLLKLGRLNDALGASERAIALDAQRPEGWLAKGSVLRELGRNDEAVAAFNRALAINPLLAPAWITVGGLFLSKKDFRSALEAFEMALAADPDNAYAWRMKALALRVGSERPVEALESYDRAISLDPGDVTSRVARAEIFVQLGRLADAHAAVAAVRADVPEHYGAMIVEGDVLVACARPMDAVRAYSRAAKARPTDSTPWTKMGDLLRENGGHEGAITAYRQALVADPTHRTSLWGLAQSLWKLTRHEEALSVMERFHALGYGAAVTFGSEALLLREMKRHAEAVSLVDRAIAMDARIAFLWILKAQTLCEMGAYTDAISAYRHALTIEPNNRAASLGLEQAMRGGIKG
ncbi:MAG: tetratricopeptide repeat protein [Thermoanaerobaculia bacterium]|nr:tetratricopeptide repeat protein [Thermoanaerobaculia bacterium]